jgi:hypothetical protein
MLAPPLVTPCRNYQKLDLAALRQFRGRRLTRIYKMARCEVIVQIGISVGIAIRHDPHRHEMTEALSRKKNVDSLPFNRDLESILSLAVFTGPEPHRSLALKPL